MRTSSLVVSALLAAALLALWGGAPVAQPALAQPGNDNFADAVVIGGLSFTDSLSTVDATTEADEPTQCDPFEETGATVWYAFTASKKMVLEANTFGSSYDTVLAAFTGTSLPDLIQLTCNDDTAGLQSRVVFTAERGQTIFFQVGGFFGEQGDLVFNVLKGKAFPNKPIAVSGSQSAADASFFSIDGSGVETSTFVFASDNTFTDPSGTLQGTDLFLDIFQFDPGGPSPNDDRFRQFSGFASPAPEQFQVNGNLESATLSAVVNVCEFTFEVPARGRKPPPPLNCFDVAVDLSWTGSGDVQTTSGRSIIRSDGCRIRSTFTELFRPAEASGSIIADSSDYTGGAPGFGSMFTFSFQDKLSGDCGF